MKVAWHPGWRTDDGSPLHLAAPGLMLLVPRSETTTIRWSMAGATRAGLALTAAAALVLVALALRPLRLPRFEGASARLSPALAAASLLALLALGAAAAARHPWIDRAARLARGQERMRAREWDAAERELREVLRGREAHPLKDDAAMHLGLVAAERGDSVEALARWGGFLRDHPVSTYRGEVLLRSARLLRERGDVDEAARLLREAVSAPLAPPHWRQAAVQELASLAAPGDTP